MATPTRRGTSDGNTVVLIMKICIVIPVCNEEAVIERNLKIIVEYAQQLPEPATVIAVNDGSHDRSGKILIELKKQYDPNIFHAISYDLNRGYGGALKVGTQYAIDNQFDYAVFMDSDLTNHPRYLTLFYAKMAQGCEYIKATRYAPGGGMAGVAWKRRFFSRVGSTVGRLLFHVPLTDVTNGFRAVKIEILRKLDLKENGFAIIMEELAQAKRYVWSFGEVPYILTERTPDQGATHFPYTFATIRKYLGYALKGGFYARPE